MKANDVISPVGLVATPDSIEEFQERLEALSGPERTVATLYSTMAWNLAHKLLSEALGEPSPWNGSKPE